MAHAGSGDYFRFTWLEGLYCFDTGRVCSVAVSNTLLSDGKRRKNGKAVSLYRVSEMWDHDDV
jgi:hypothetical protein